jgi:ADP-ribose pyrophosphatase
MSRAVFETPWFSVEELTVTTKRGEELYYKIHSPPGIVVVPVTPDGNFVLIRQFRPALGRMTLEFPAGGVDRDEDPAVATARELREEAGYVCTSLHEMVRAPLRIEREDVMNYFFIGMGAQPIENWTPSEDIEVLTLAPMELKQEILAGRFDHIAALPILLLAQWRLGLSLFPQDLILTQPPS